MINPINMSANNIQAVRNATGDQKPEIDWLKVGTAAGAVVSAGALIYIATKK